MIFPQDANEEPVAQPSFSRRRYPPYPSVAQDFFAERERTIILVDPSSIVKHMIELTLQKEHIYIITANDAISGLTGIADHHPHLILLSVQLSRMDGYQVCQVIRKSSQFARIPVIMLGKQGASSFDAMRSRLAGSTAFLQRPFNQHQLISMIKKYLPA